MVDAYSQVNLFLMETHYTTTALRLDVVVKRNENETQKATGLKQLLELRFLWRLNQKCHNVLSRS